MVVAVASGDCDPGYNGKQIKQPLARPTGLTPGK